MQGTLVSRGESYRMTLSSHASVAHSSRRSTTEAESWTTLSPRQLLSPFQTLPSVSSVATRADSKIRFPQLDYPHAPIGNYTEEIRGEENALESRERKRRRIGSSFSPGNLDERIILYFALLREDAD